MTQALRSDLIAPAGSSKLRRWGRRGALCLAALRVCLGAGALALPEPAGKMWIGAGAKAPGVRVLLRALGGRDVALGIGALVATRGGGGDAALRRWVAMGALSDAVDTVATVAGHQRLPRLSRILVVAASAAAAVSGAVAVSLLSEGGPAAGTTGRPGTTPSGSPG